MLTVYTVYANITYHADRTVLILVIYNSLYNVDTLPIKATQTKAQKAMSASPADLI